MRAVTTHCGPRPPEILGRLQTTALLLRSLRRGPFAMHIHLPKPLHGWRALVGEIGIIVVGVSIALSAEQFAEFLHNRAQVRHGEEALTDNFRRFVTYTAELDAYLMGRGPGYCSTESVRASRETVQCRSQRQSMDARATGRLPEGGTSAPPSAILIGSVDGTATRRSAGACVGRL